MESKKKEFNAWPLGIAGMIVATIFLIIWTIDIALKNPVQLENKFLANYHAVDDNINDISKNQELFSKKYNISIEKSDFIIGQNSVKLIVTDKNGNKINNAKVEILLTRPHTTQEDKHLIVRENDGYYVSDAFDIVSKGRWLIYSKANVEGYQGFSEMEFFAK
ncbi:MAG: FixH family protein [Campylobacterales bacterium]|nr:FixH family protein [Campylobacterales bacterium]